MLVSEIQERRCLTLRTATGVHGGELAVENEAEPAVGTIGQLQSSRIRPHVQAIPTT